MTEDLKPADERVSTWGIIVCGNVMIAGSHPAGVIIGLIYLAWAALIVWSDKRGTAPGGA